MNEIVQVKDKQVVALEWKGQRVVTTAQLAEIYETDINNVQNNFSNNKENFKKDVHYFYLKGEELKVFKRQVNDIELPIIDKFASHFYLWTRRGASRHCKILDTEKAWEQFDALEENYYNPKKQENKIPQGKELLALAVLEAQKTIEEQTKAIERMKPKEIFADAVATSKTSILVGELAKLLKQNGYKTGQNRLFEQLRQEGYLIKKKGTDYNMPTQRSMELGLFEIKETTISNADGSIRVTKTPKITGKGQQYFINKFLN